MNSPSDAKFDAHAVTLAAYATRYLELRIAELRQKRAELSDEILMLEREKEDIQNEWCRASDPRRV